MQPVSSMQLPITRAPAVLPPLLEEQDDAHDCGARPDDDDDDDDDEEEEDDDGGTISHMTMTMMTMVWFCWLFD